MHCRDVELLLSEYVDRALAERERDRVAAHLDGCAGCRRELAGMEDTLAALDSAPPAPAPDLWHAVSRRMGATLACAQAEELLPAYLAGELADSRATSVRCHLDACGACAASAAAYERSLKALEQVAASCPAVDLWPAFVRRLERETARPAGVGARWHGWLRTPAFRPALGAALLLLAFAARGMIQTAPAPVQPGPVMVRNGGAAVGDLPKTGGAKRGGDVSTVKSGGKVRPVRRVLASAKIGRRERLAPRREQRERPRVRPDGGRLLMAAGNSQKPPVRASHRRPEGIDREPGALRMASNDLPAVDATPRTVAEPLNLSEEKKVLAQVVPCLEMLAGMEEAKANPLGKEPDAQ